MEDMANDLKLAELKQENLCKSVDQLHAQTSSVLLLTCQWKNLETHFESTKNSLLKQAQDLALQEKKIVETTKTPEQRGKDANFKLKKDWRMSWWASGEGRTLGFS